MSQMRLLAPVVAAALLLGGCGGGGQKPDQQGGDSFPREDVAGQIQTFLQSIHDKGRGDRTCKQDVDLERMTGGSYEDCIGGIFTALTQGSKSAIGLGTQLVGYEGEQVQVDPSGVEPTSDASVVAVHGPAVTVVDPDDDSSRPVAPDDGVVFFFVKDGQAWKFAGNNLDGDVSAVPTGK